MAKAGQWLLSPVRCWKIYVKIREVILFWWCGDTCHDWWSHQVCFHKTHLYSKASVQLQPQTAQCVLNHGHPKCRTMPMVWHAFTQPVCTSHAINTSIFKDFCTNDYNHRFKPRISSRQKSPKNPVGHFSTLNALCWYKNYSIWYIKNVNKPATTINWTKQRQKLEMTYYIFLVVKHLEKEVNK